MAGWVGDGWMGGWMGGWMDGWMDRDRETQKRHKGRSVKHRSAYFLNYDNWRLQSELNLIKYGNAGT